VISSAAHERIVDVQVTDDALVVDFADGRTLSVPLVWYPRLLNASAEQRSDWELIGGGEGIHWPQIDEDLSAEGLLRGIPASAARPHALRQAREAAEEYGSGKAPNLAAQFFAEFGEAVREKFEESFVGSRDPWRYPNATDAARRRAEELHVNLFRITGTGQDGRITVHDVEAAAEAHDRELRN
jgi:pyruvate/2-oxoglutarate dehydrogenase complex dihydrolipoamide acyltransferase (E2) component